MPGSPAHIRSHKQARSRKLSEQRKYREHSEQPVFNNNDGNISIEDIVPKVPLLALHNPLPALSFHNPNHNSKLLLPTILHCLPVQSKINR